MAQLRTATDRADVKLSLLEQYMSLFSLYNQSEVLMRHLEESELRLKVIWQWNKERHISSDDVMRSETEVHDDRHTMHVM